MRRLLFTAGLVLGLVVMASASWAGDYHTGISLICADCHTMHFSQTHGYNPDGNGNFTQLGGTEPHEFLLRNDINDLCLSCHDNQALAPDVFEANSNGFVRQAGALNEEGGDGLYPPPTGHTLNSVAVAPGSEPAWSDSTGLKCTACHAAHGSNRLDISSYRNLGGNGTKPGSNFAIPYASVTNDLTKWVFEDANAGVNANHYGYDHVTFNEPTTTQSQYAQFCKACHTNFHGDVGGGEIGGVPFGAGFEEFHRHPALTVNIGVLGGGHSSLSRFAGKTNQVQVMSPTGVRAGSYTTTNTDLTPSCMSCHKGHGNQNAFGLIFMLGTGTVTEQGDSGVNARNLCRQCHGQGGSSTTF